ncbi:hypothetical protein BT96DRAFT_816734, partial [Gymnopus androsaceus JB14]
NEISTLCRHLGLKHEVCFFSHGVKPNNFTSMIPKDIKIRKNAVEAAAASQTVIDDHAVPLPRKEWVLPYLDELFQQAAIEWLIETDQPISALEHPRFWEMIGTAARTTNSVKIPNCKATHQSIIALFKKNLYNLWTRFAVNDFCCYMVLSAYCGGEN